MNGLKSGFQALRAINQIRIPIAYHEKGGVIDGAMKKE